MCDQIGCCAGHERPARNTLSLANHPGVAAGALLVALLALAVGPVAGADQPATTPQPATTRQAPTTRPAPQTPGELFDPAAVWTLHLTFTPEQWAAMEPKGGFDFGAMFGGPRPGGPGQPGPGGPGGPRPQAFGWSMLLAPAFMKDGDADHDGKLSRDEFRGLAERWFGVWDKAKAGKVSAEQLRAGLNATLTPPMMAPPGGGGPGGNRGIGISLQGADGKRNGLASAMGIEFAYVHADLEFQGRTLKDVGVRYKGNGTFMESRGSLKRSMKVDLNRHAEGQKLADVTGFNLHNNVTDASWMNEVLSHRLYRDAGLPAPRTVYARVYVTVPGRHDRAYFGLYSLVEDVGKAFVKERFGSSEGALLKPVTPELFADLGDDWARYNQTYDPKTKLTDAQKRRVIEFARLVTRGTDDEFAAGLGDYLDLEQFARYMAVTTYLSTLDSILVVGQNYYLYLDPKTNRFHFIPWDLDHSFGQFPLMGSQQQREQLSLRKPWRGENRFLERVFAAPAFRALYQARMKEFAGSLFKPERFHQQVDETAATIRDAVKEESAEKLARFDQAVRGELLEPRMPNFGPGPGPRPGAAPGAGGPGDPGAIRVPPGSRAGATAGAAASAAATTRESTGSGTSGPIGQGGPAGPGELGGGPGGPGFDFMRPKPITPIKPFVTARWKSVTEQLAGQSEGQTLDAAGFGFGGPPPGPGGPGGPPGGPGGPPGGFGLGTLLAPAFLAGLDANKDGSLTRDEVTAGFRKWFDAWDTEKAGTLTGDQLRAGIDRAMPVPGPGGAGGGGGPPAGPGQGR